MKAVEVRKQHARSALAMMCALSIILCAGFGVPGVVAKAWAGGAGFGDDDDNSEEEGPSYFGFVRDAGGTTVPDAKVTVAVKGRGGVVTRTDALGTYKVPGFGKDVDPKDVEVSCDKQGYKQLRVVRRSTPSNDPKIPIETECTLQRI
jgi:hypothetical protein